MSIRTFLRNAGELMIGEVVSECDELIELVDLCFVVVGRGNSENSIGIQFVPVDLVSMNPPVTLKSVIKEETKEEQVKIVIRKDAILVDNLTLKDEIVANYEEARKPRSIITPSSKIITPDTDKIVKLFD